MRFISISVEGLGGSLGHQLRINKLNAGTLGKSPRDS